MLIASTLPCDYHTPCTTVLDILTSCIHKCFRMWSSCGQTWYAIIGHGLSRRTDRSPSLILQCNQSLVFQWCMPMLTLGIVRYVGGFPMFVQQCFTLWCTFRSCGVEECRMDLQGVPVRKWNNYSAICPVSIWQQRTWLLQVCKP